MGELEDLRIEVAALRLSTTEQAAEIDRLVSSEQATTRPDLSFVQLSPPLVADFRTFAAANTVGSEPWRHFLRETIRRLDRRLLRVDDVWVGTAARFAYGTPPSAPFAALLVRILGQVGRT